MTKAAKGLDPVLTRKAQIWSNDVVFDQETRSTVARMLAESEQNPGPIVDAFYRDLEFGTGGMRGVLGPGTARLNKYNIWRASAALAIELQALRKRDSSLSKREYVGIAYDSRRYSAEFAQAAAEVFVGYGLKVLITDSLQPVPVLSFLLRERQCLGGVCITASHNPPDYNGYKVYGPTGGQITPPLDANIIEHYKRLDDYSALKRADFNEGLLSGDIEWVSKDFVESYRIRLRAEHSYFDPKNLRENLKIVFTPLHGTTGKIVPDALADLGFDQVRVVEEQREPDGFFPTVKFPNPEDPAALEMAVALADKTAADLVLGTDPDGDRIGIVVRDKSGHWLTLNGNQIGCLLTEFVLSRLKDLGRMPKNPLVIKTIVTTDMQADIARHYRVDTEETLTGFKWICQRIEEYEAKQRVPYRQFVCGGEESFGFLAGRFVRDKDGIAACTIAAQMIAYYKSQGKTLDLVLDELFLQHGVYLEHLHTLTLPGRDGAERIKAAMERVRLNPPLQLGGLPVVQIRDFEKLQEFNLAQGKLEAPTLLAFPQSDVLQFILSDHSKISVRPSGTEPKIKFYVSVRRKVKPGMLAGDLEPLKRDCVSSIKSVLDDFLRIAAA